MACYSGPEIVENGLVLSIDASNLKGYDKFENILLYSEDFSNAYWTKSNVSVTSNAITSPTGSSNASKLVESASTAVHELIRGSDGALSVGTDTYITFSIFAKAAERQYCYIRSAGNSKRIAVVVDLSNGTFNVTNWGFTLNSSATVTPYPNGWYRITATAQSNYPAAPGWAGQFIVSPIDSYQSAGNVGGGGYSYAGNGTSGIYIWGAHYEFGPGISDYYATTGTAKNRGTTWTDLSGNGNNGTLTNGPTYSSGTGGSIVFDGSNDYVITGLNLNSLPTVTFCGWVYLNSTSSVGIMGNDANTYGRVIRSTGGKYEILNTTSFLSTNINIITNQWHHIAVVWSTTSCNFYINYNQVQQSFAGEVATYDDATNTYFGTTGGGAVQYLNGNISQVQIYKRALTSAEIQQNYNATKSRYGL